MRVIIESVTDDEVINDVETLSEAENSIIENLQKRNYDMDAAYMYGYPKYYVDLLDIVVDFGNENFHYRIESVFENVF